MELLITIAYFFLVRLIFFDYKLLKYNLFWKLVTIGLWVAALTTEVLFLGQFTPYSKEMFVQARVVQMAPEYGGVVTEIGVKPNVQVKKGDMLFRMDTQPWEGDAETSGAQVAAAQTSAAQLAPQLEAAKAAVSSAEAELALRKLELDEINQAAKFNAVALTRVDQMKERVADTESQLAESRAKVQELQLAIDAKYDGLNPVVAEAQGQLKKSQYSLQQRTIVAPSDGYVVNLQLHVGQYVRLKTPVMTFVSTEDYWIIAKVPQVAVQRLKRGDYAEVAFLLYPGKVFPAVVDSVVWATGEAQGMPTGVLPHMSQINPTLEYVVKLRMSHDDPDHPLRFGATGLAAMYTDTAADALIFLRQLEIRSESYLNYFYNPF